MSNKTASFSASLSYTGPLGQAASLAPPVIVACKYAGQSDGAFDLDAAALTGQALTVPLGSIASVTGLLVKNNCDADVEVKINDNISEATGTLASGTVTIALASRTGEHLSAERVTSHGTAGILSVRRSGGNVIVESWLAGTGIQASDVSDIKVVQRAGAFSLPPGGALAIFSPATEAPTTPITKVQLTTEEATTVAGSVGYLLFGDPS